MASNPPSDFAVAASRAYIPLIARRLAGVDTSPVLVIDGEGVGDSSAILQAIEQRWPEPALMPPDEAGRRRALELEEWFAAHVLGFAEQAITPQTRAPRIGPAVPVAPVAPVTQRLVAFLGREP